MSVIVVKKYEDHIMLGTDTQMSTNDVIGYSSKSFYHKETNTCVAYAGVLDEGQLFHIYYRQFPLETFDDFGLLEYMHDFSRWLDQYRAEWDVPNNTYIMVRDDKVFTVQGFVIREVHEYTACGSGEPYALTALELGADIYTALDQACKFDLYCNAPYDIYRMPLITNAL